MDILYYSNYCPHSQNVLKYITRKNLIERLNCICVDKRVRDHNNNQIYIVLENGKRVILPPNVSSVPSLLQVKKNYSVLQGEDILKYFESQYTNNQGNSELLQQNGEPMGFQLTGISASSNILSEQYTLYDMTPDELAAKGKGGRRQMYNYIPATHDTDFIETPEDRYRPDKLDNSVTVDTLQQKRNEDIQKTLPPPHSQIQSI